jgi:AcrR family transcriptional regulator
MQRRRLLTATVELVFERGVQAITIAHISDRAGVSRKTFYDVFSDREACLLAAFEEAVGQARGVVIAAAEGAPGWRERVRAGLLALLSFLDCEPVTGRLLVVEALGAGASTLEARRNALARVIAVVDEGRGQLRVGVDLPPLTAEGVVGAVFSVIHARMLACPPQAMDAIDGDGGDARPLVELAGPLMAMIVQPYLGRAAAGRELERSHKAVEVVKPRLPADPFKDLPIRLTYRTARVLAAIDARPGMSSKQIALASDVADEGQMSRLLTRLERVGLIHNTGPGPAKGEANVWSMTPKGQSVHTIIAEQTRRESIIV